MMMLEQEKKTKNAGWLHEDCRKAIKVKNEARKKRIIRDTRANKEEYMKRNEARKICRDKKRETINNEIKELEIETRENENRKICKKLETLTKTYPMWSYWSPIGCLPRWQIGEHSPDMEGTGEIKYLGQTKTSTAALRLTEGSVKSKGRKP